MKNDGKHFLRLSNGVFYPDEIEIFEHQGIKLFIALYAGQYRVSEAKTGYIIGATSLNEEDAIESAKQTIDSKGVAKVRESVRMIIEKTKEGMSWSSDEQKWISMYGDEKC